MKITVKIILSFTLAVFLAMLIFLLGSIHFNTTFSRYEYQIENSMPVINSLHNILRGGLRTIGATSEIVMLRESRDAGFKLKDKVMQDELDELKNGYRTLVDHHEKFSDLMLDYGSDAFVYSENVDQAVNRLINSSFSLVELKEGISGKEIHNLKEELEEADNYFTKHINQTIEAVESDFAVIQQQMVEKSKQTRIFLACLLLLLLTVSIGSVFYILHSFKSGLAILTKASGQIALGNFDLKLDEKRTDEFGDLFSEFQKMANEISAARNFADRSLLKLEKYSADLKDKNKEYEEFVFVTSHDLQEPLRKIMTYASRIRKGIVGHVDQEYTNYITKVVESSSYLREKLDMLSVYSRIGVEKDNFSKVDLEKIVVNVANRYMGAMDNSSIVFKIETLPIIEGRKDHLEKMFNFLFDNSCKFRDDKPLEVKVSSIFDDRDNFCRIIVEDNGCGFDQKYAGEIFRVFHSLDNNKYGGLGMGLAIVKKIVEVHGGTISVESSIGNGTKFTLELMISHEPRDENLN